jgi:uncharacterized protein (TIGR02147 family)
VRPSIFNYLNLSRFLADRMRYDAKLAEVRRTPEALAGAIGCSPSTLRMIATGRRLPSADLLLSLCRALHLSPAETAFAEALVDVEKSDQPETVLHFKTRLDALRPAHATRALPATIFEAMGAWYHAVVFELIGLSDFQADPEWIARRLDGAISPATARECLLTLDAMGLIHFDAEGRVAKLSPTIAFLPPGKNVAVRDFHQAMARQAAAAIQRFGPEHRKVLGLTISIDPTRLGQAYDLMLEFVERFNAVMDTPTPSETYQLNLQFFPLTTQLETHA